MIYGSSVATAAALLALRLAGGMRGASAAGLTSRKLDVIEGCSEDNWGE